MRRTALILLGLRWLRINWTRKGINAVRHERSLRTKSQLIAMLYAQFSGARGLREIEAELNSHAGKLYHLGGCPVSRSALAEANASRPVEVFSGLPSIV